VTFQSHAGSIEALAGVLYAPGDQVRFNPTLVRLRLDIEVLESGIESGFNPTLVRLRPSAGASSLGGVWGFNPTLVRLRHVSILQLLRLHQVSIPRWFD